MSETMLKSDEVVIAVVGLGYVGLPLAIEFGKKTATRGFDIDADRIRELQQAVDTTLEVSETEFAAAGQLRFTSDEADLDDCNVFIVTVPTPIDDHKSPDLRPLLSATTCIARHLKPGNVVVYESTVYPGATEEVCVPVLERDSGLQFNRDFFAGYSPERINPGDRQHRLPNITKVTSGSTPEAAEFIDALYAGIIEAGTYRASSIKVAEAAKVIENTQRDVNIGLINELAIIFNTIGIDTEEVLKAAETKWNFLPFRPGLVGGHCIGVDPYYLTYKAQSLGYHPEIILSGRRLNDSMPQYIVNQLVKAMLKKRIQVMGARALVLGLSFKENCPDLRNTRVVDMIAEMQEYGLEVDLHDPWVDKDEVKQEYGLELVAEPQERSYDAVVVAVAHRQFAPEHVNIRERWAREVAVVYDIKYMLPYGSADLRL